MRFNHAAAAAAADSARFISLSLDLSISNARPGGGCLQRAKPHYGCSGAAVVVQSSAKRPREQRPAPLLQDDDINAFFRRGSVIFARAVRQSLQGSPNGRSCLKSCTGFSGRWARSLEV